MARRQKLTPGTLILGGVFAVVLGICVVAAVLQISQSPKVKSNLGPATFVIGNAKGYAKLADKDGPFVFRDPRAGVVHGYVKGAVANGYSDVHLAPDAGLLVLFPCWMEHFVELHNSDEPRICIAFNANEGPAKR